MNEVIKKLAELSTKLDESELVEYADRVDDLIEKLAAVTPVGVKLPNGSVIYTSAEISNLLAQDATIRQYIAALLYGQGKAAHEATMGPDVNMIVQNLVNSLKAKGLVADQLPSNWQLAKEWAAKKILNPAKQMLDDVELPKIQRDPAFVGGYGSQSNKS